MRRTKSEALETRSALLDAAERVFMEKGVSQTTLTDIAKAAGVTRGAIYWHFADKAALFFEMQQRGCLPFEFFESLRPPHEPADPMTELRSTALVALEYLASNEQSQRVCTILLLRCEYVGEMAEVGRRMREAEDRMSVSALTAFRLAESRGELSEDWTPEAATRAYSCTMTGLITDWLRSECSFDMHDSGRKLLDALFASFRTDLASAEAPVAATSRAHGAVSVTSQ